MPNSTTETTSPVRFGTFELDLRSGELRKSGLRVHLADQPLQVLTLLLEHPGEMVTREELRNRLWSNDTFVDFDHGLNAAVKRLREALGDSADHPRFIETIPRHGYRFVAPVVTPEREDHAEPAITVRKGARRNRWTAVALGLVLLLCAAGWGGLRWRQQTGMQPILQSIAVLPFEDMSPQRDQEYLSDGLAEEVLTALARIPELRVSARTSSFQFKGKNQDLRDIGSKLNVKWVLEGGVRKNGTRVRITAQLINVADGFHLWSNVYERDLTDIFALQEEIAGSVADSLKVSLLARNPATAVHAVNGGAYNAYLQGRYFTERRSQEDVRRGIGYFEKATKLDPEFASAWAGLAAAWTNFADSGYISVEEGYGKAREAVDTALKLDPNLAEAHQVMGWIKRTHDWDWNGSDASFQRALALAPGDAKTIWRAASLDYTLGRYDAALALDRKSVEMDPLDTSAYLNLGVVNWYAGHYGEAERALRKALEINPRFPVAGAYLARVHLTQNRNEEALRAAEQETDEAWRLYALAIAYYSLGRKTDSDAALTELIAKHGGEFGFQVAEVYGWRGERDLAFEWLERAYDRRDPGFSEFKGNPLFKGIELDPRHAALMKKLNLPL